MIFLLPVFPWQADLGVPPEFCRLLRSNTLGVCVMNQRRFVPWSAGANKACGVVLPARIMMSSSASALFAAVDDVVPAVCLERLRQLCEKALASVACCRSALASTYSVDGHRHPRRSQSQRLATCDLRQLRPELHVAREQRQSDLAQTLRLCSALLRLG